jgi:branched-chain amino acid transport system ATP-binding protein
VVDLRFAQKGGLMATTLETIGLTKTFGAVTAASNISVQIERDAIVGMIGGNGAGKTTFLNLITGYLKPDSGTIRHDGRDITALSPRQVTQLGICRSFQIPQIFGSLTTYENLLVGTGISRASRKRARNVGEAADVDAAVDQTLARFHLANHRDSRSGVLPEGVRKLLDIAMAMVIRPRILLLDEPTSGVSADEKFALMDVVFEAIRGEGVTVLFVEHDIEIVRRYARRVLAFYDGRVIADGPPEEVLNDGEVRKLVVGEDAAPASARGAGSC